jgi:hypothetical protein
MTLPHGARSAPGCDDSSTRVLTLGAHTAPHVFRGSLPWQKPATALHLVRSEGKHGRA